MSREVHGLDLWTGHFSRLRKVGNRKTTKNKLAGSPGRPSGTQSRQWSKVGRSFVPAGEGAREATIKAERGGAQGSSRLKRRETKPEVPTQSRGQTAQPSDVRGEGCHAFELKDEIVSFLQRIGETSPGQEGHERA